MSSAPFHAQPSHSSLAPITATLPPLKTSSAHHLKRSVKSDLAMRFPLKTALPRQLHSAQPYWLIWRFYPCSNEDYSHRYPSKFPHKSGSHAPALIAQYHVKAFQCKISSYDP